MYGVHGEQCTGVIYGVEVDALMWQQGLTCAVQLGRMDMPSIRVASQLINIITITLFLGIIRDTIIFCNWHVVQHPDNKYKWL